MSKFLSHKKKMVNDIKRAISCGRSPVDISINLFLKSCELRRCGACDSVWTMYLRTADIISGMTRDGLILAVSRGDFL